MKGYYFITDEKLTKRDIYSDAEDAVKAGVELLQYRSKTSSTRKMCEEAGKLRRICRQTGLATKLIINDRVDVCLAVDADGVHLGQDDMRYEDARRLLGKDKMIGLTVRSVEEAAEAEKLGADYLGAGPVFHTDTKKDAGDAKGLELIREIKKICSLPVFAIGGITADNAGDVISAGADGICAISGVVCCDDALGQMKRFQEMF